MATAQSSVASQSDGNAAEQQIQKVLQAQTEAWNHGDLEGYMAGYWNSPDLTFFSNATETHGWQPTLDRYKARYQGSGKTMGKVSFPELKITSLSDDAAFVRGQWQLEMPDGKKPHGMFTLLVRKFPEGWRIVHDHSSGE
ncbi:YybH family protein [Candidatus Korobacter versatilis]|uniref:YybH family protein n=1 Tax=Candidatus Korobacter versatilis TaxID=658062 RepID=UPI000673D961|nr:nuclear transport factor 2 family protein [Candidatus Koribacter versatilis]